MRKATKKESANFKLCCFSLIFQGSEAVINVLSSSVSFLLSVLMMTLKWFSPPATPMEAKVKNRSGSLRTSGLIKVVADGRGGGGFPSFIPKEIEKIRDPLARSLARRIVRLPVRTEFSESRIMSSCVKPQIRSEINPVVLLHSFDSSCLEWRSAYPLLEKTGLEAWAVDLLGWGFSDLERLPPCNAASKRYHLYELWKSYIKRPMVLVGPSLGAAVAIDFAINYPEAVEKMVFINPSVYAEGTGNLAKLPKIVAYAGVSLLKSFPLRLYANTLTFNGITLSEGLDWTNVGRLHCHLPWWKDATVDFMTSGGYNVVTQIKQVRQKVLIIYSEHDLIVSNQLAVRLQRDLPYATMRKIRGCGHLPHVDKPNHVAKLIADFTQEVIVTDRTELSQI